MSNMIFYTNPQSRGRVVQWMLNECEADYQTVNIDYADIKNSDYLSINPMGKLPALVDDGITITEGIAICTYLADKYPKKQLAPTVGTPQRGAYYRWLFFASNVLEPAFMVYLGYLKRQSTPETNRTLGFGQLADALKILEDTLKHAEYLCGEEFMTPDLYISAMLSRFKMNNEELVYGEIIDNYLSKILPRPSAKSLWD